MNCFKSVTPLFWCTLFLTTVFVGRGWCLQTASQFKEGNFLLPSSQQPGPLFGFGQNVIDAGALQVLGYVDYRKAHHQEEVNFFPGFLYGVTDSLAFLALIQSEVYANQDGVHTSRFNQASLQLEYSLYADKRTRRIDELTVVGGLNCATSPSLQRNFFNPSIFLGLTVSRTTIDWYFFTSPGLFITTKRNNSQPGNSLVLQAGVGRNIPTISQSICLVMVESNFICEQRDRKKGEIDFDSGKQLFYVGPTL